MKMNTFWSRNWRKFAVITLGGIPLLLGAFGMPAEVVGAIAFFTTGYAGIMDSATKPKT